MITIILPKANQVVSGGDEIESVTIKILGDINECLDTKSSLASVKNYYDELAHCLANALYSSLPQGVIEPLTIKLMQKRVSIYCGLMEKDGKNK